jgi:hypothetical protein
MAAGAPGAGAPPAMQRFCAPVCSLSCFTAVIATYGRPRTTRSGGAADRGGAESCRWFARPHSTVLERSRNRTDSRSCCTAAATRAASTAASDLGGPVPAAPASTSPYLACSGRDSVSDTGLHARGMLGSPGRRAHLGVERRDLEAFPVYLQPLVGQRAPLHVRGPVPCGLFPAPRGPQRVPRRKTHNLSGTRRSGARTPLGVARDPARPAAERPRAVRGSGATLPHAFQSPKMMDDARE